MKRVISRNIAVIVFVGIFLFLANNNVSAQNTINGLVFDNNRQPVSKIDVELLDNFERLVRRTKTNGSGLYFFPNLRAGVYYIKVGVSGTNFKRVKERIDLGATNRTIQTGAGSRISGVEIKQQDIYLQIDPRKLDRSINDTTGVIFAQEIPKEAEDLYERGIKSLKSKKHIEAIKQFENALEIFPDYFNALVKLGETYLSLDRYAEAESVFRKAGVVNKKSFVSFFNLAIAQNKLGKSTDAVTSLKRANEIDGRSINSHLLLGIIQRDLKSFEEAEETLLKAKSLGKNKEADVNWQLALLFYFDLKKLDRAVDELNFYLKNLSKKERKDNPKKIDGIKKLIQKIQKEAKQNT